MRAISGFCRDSEPHFLLKLAEAQIGAILRWVLAWMGISGLPVRWISGCLFSAQVGGVLYPLVMLFIVRQVFCQVLFFYNTVSLSWQRGRDPL